MTDKKVIDIFSQDFLNKATQPLIDIVSKANNDAIEIIAKRINDIGKLSATDINTVNQLLRTSDIKKIENIITEMTGKSPKTIESIFNNIALENQELVKDLYLYRNIEQVAAIKSATIGKIIKSATKNAQKDFLNISKTTGFNLGGKYVPIQKAYNNIIDKAVYTVQQGYVDYQTAMRSSVIELSKKGLTTVDFKSGYKQRLDSAVRRNILDGAREMSMNMRQIQAEEFGYDQVIISLHYGCATDHLNINGKTFSKKEFEKINGSLERPVGTLNCKHSIFYGVKGITKNPYSDEDRKKAKENSTEKITFKGLGGKDLNMTRYEATQYQRNLETLIRRNKDTSHALDLSGDKVGKANIDKKVKDYTKEYKRISTEAGLEPELNRLRVFNK